MLEAKKACSTLRVLFDSPAKTLNRVMRYEYFGYPKDFLFQYQKAISAVTRADVLRVAKERFVPENLAIVAVGNSKEFGKPLSTLGKVNIIDLTIPSRNRSLESPMRPRSNTVACCSSALNRPWAVRIKSPRSRTSPSSLTWLPREG